MAVNLTEGAIELMCNGGNELSPVLQVTDIRLVNASSSSTNNTERYRLVLSDGKHMQQGMLATQMNDLVKSGKLQKSSVVQLTQYVCNSVQGRMIIIIVNLEMLLENCGLIGDPKQYGTGVPRPPSLLQSSVDQMGPIARNAQHGIPQYSGSVPTAKQNVIVGSSLQPAKLEGRVDVQSQSSAFSVADSARHAASNAPYMYSKPEYGAANSSSTTVAGLYGAQKGGYQNPKGEVSRAPLSTRPQPYQQNPPTYMNRGPIAKNDAGVRPIPIAALNPYQGRWTIKARVTTKSDIRHYNNAKGDGKVFSFDLLDSDGGEIRVICFNAVVDQFFNQIEAGKVYLISKGSLKPAQKNFNHLRNDHEIVLDSTSIVQPCLEDDNSIPPQQFDFRPISDIESMDNNSVVDLIGVVSSISPPFSFMRKNGIETQRRAIQLKDNSGRSVELTLWGNFCSSDGQTLQSICDSGRSPVLAVKAARVSDFNGKVIGTISQTQLFIEPDFIPEGRKIRQWFDGEGKNIPFVSITREAAGSNRTDVRKTVSQIKDEKLGTSEKPDWIMVCAIVTHVKVDNFCYTACPRSIGERQCSKKVTNNGDGKWWCERCEQQVDECDYRYILQLQIQDHTGLTWVTAFQECGEVIMGIPAKDLFLLKYEEQDDSKFQDIVSGVRFTKFSLKLKVKEEMFSDEQRVKSTVVKAERVNFSSECKLLLDLMNNVKVGESTAVQTGLTQTTGTNSSRFISAGVGQSAVASSYGATTGISGIEMGGSGNARVANQYGGAGYPMINQSGLYSSCNGCGSTGHSSINCPTMKDGPEPSTGSLINRPIAGASTGNTGSECYKCHQFGHWARDCPSAGMKAIPPAYGSGSFPPGKYGGIQNQRVGGF